MKQPQERELSLQSDGMTCDEQVMVGIRLHLNLISTFELLAHGIIYKCTAGDMCLLEPPNHLIGWQKMHFVLRELQSQKRTIGEPNYCS